MKSGSETMLYLQSKAEKEFDLRKEELKMKKEEMELLYRKSCSWKQLKNKPQQLKIWLKYLNIFRHNKCKCVAADAATATAVPNA